MECGQPLACCSRATVTAFTNGELEWGTQGQGSLRATTAQAFERFRKRSNQEDNGSRLLLLIIALEKDNERVRVIRHQFEAKYGLRGLQGQQSPAATEHKMPLAHPRLNTRVAEHWRGPGWEEVGPSGLGWDILEGALKNPETPEAPGPWFMQM